MADAGYYTDAQRARQDEQGTRPLADALEAMIISEVISPEHQAFIGSRDVFFLSTVTPEGAPTVSYKGGPPGVVQVLDERTLAFPSYDGNGMFLSMGNVAATAKIGLLFIDFETPHRVRVQATATLSTETADLARFPGVDYVVLARTDQVFVNCGRYIHKHRRVESSRYVPDAEGNAPVPAWKRIDAIQPLLPERDHGRAEADGGLIDAAEYARRAAAGEP